jgi:hypothetical protein
MEARSAILALTAVLLAVPAIAAPERRPPAELKISWDYGGVPEGMKLYELKAGDWAVWTTSVAAPGDETPLLREIPDATVRLMPGERRRVALYYRNATDRPVRFFAAPHSVSPARSALGFKFLCLCTNRVYTVAPGEIWYRVVELRLARDFAGKRLEIVHQLLAADEESAAEFKNGMSRLEAP